MPQPPQPVGPADPADPAAPASPRSIRSPDGHKLSDIMEEIAALKAAEDAALAAIAQSMDEKASNAVAEGEARMNSLEAESTAASSHLVALAAARMKQEPNSPNSPVSVAIRSEVPALPEAPLPPPFGSEGACELLEMLMMCDEKFSNRDFLNPLACYLNRFADGHNPTARSLYAWFLNASVDTHVLCRSASTPFLICKSSSMWLCLEVSMYVYIVYRV